MKKIILILSAATMCFTACKKQPLPAPAAAVQTETVTDDDFKGSKARVAGLHMKKSDNGLEFDYDLVIKEVSDDKYEASIKIQGLTLNGKKAPDAGKMAIYGVVLALNSTKESKETPLAAELKIKDIKDLADGKVIYFPQFTYKGNLAYELIEVHSTISVDGGSVTVYDESSFSFGSVYFTLADTKINLKSADWDISEGITGAAAIKGKEAGHEKVTLSPTYTNFALSYSSKKGGERCDVEESNTIFILPKGHTVKQEPKVSKVKLLDDNGYVAVTISGDPAMAVKTVYYQPEPLSGKEQPVMKFVATHYNMQQGVQRFLSTQTWEQVYGKTAFNKTPKTGFVLGFSYGLQYD